MEIYIITMSAHNHMLLGSIRMTCQRSSEKRVNTVAAGSGCKLPSVKNSVTLLTVAIVWIKSGQKKWKEVRMPESNYIK